jgi:hypothetical protein
MINDDSLARIAANQPAKIYTHSLLISNLQYETRCGVKFGANPYGQYIASRSVSWYPPKKEYKVWRGSLPLVMDVGPVDES